MSKSHQLVVYLPVASEKTRSKRSQAELRRATLIRIRMEDLSAILNWDRSYSITSPNWGAKFSFGCATLFTRRETSAGQDVRGNEVKNPLPPGVRAAFPEATEDQKGGSDKRVGWRSL